MIFIAKQSNLSWYTIWLIMWPWTSLIYSSQLKKLMRIYKWQRPSSPMVIWNWTNSEKNYLTNRIGFISYIFLSYWLSCVCPVFKWKFVNIRPTYHRTKNVNKTGDGGHDTYSSIGLWTRWAKYKMNMIYYLLLQIS